MNKYSSSSHAGGCCSVAQLLSLFVTHGLKYARPPCPSPSPGVYPKLMSIESVRLSSPLILCCPLILLPSALPSIRAFSSELALHISWPQCWSFSFSISPFSEYSGLVFCRTEWFAVQGTLKSFFPALQLESINSLVHSHLKYLVCG